MNKQSIFINDQDIIRILSEYKDSISIIEKSLKNKKNAVLPAKQSLIPFKGAFQTIMPVMM